MKKPEEIKKGIELCIHMDGPCSECPYDKVSYNLDECSKDLLEDALVYIQHLEAELDAALADFKLYRERNINGECGVYACDLCKRGGRYEDWDGIKCPTGCTGVSHWEWRGVKKEE